MKEIINYVLGLKIYYRNKGLIKLNKKKGGQ